MKVPPKRKGNFVQVIVYLLSGDLNESPSEKEGKFGEQVMSQLMPANLNESPSEKEGKCWVDVTARSTYIPQ